MAQNFNLIRSGSLESVGENSYRSDSIESVHGSITDFGDAVDLSQLFDENFIEVIDISQLFEEQVLVGQQMVVMTDDEFDQRIGEAVNRMYYGVGVDFATWESRIMGYINFTAGNVEDDVISIGWLFEEVDNHDYIPPENYHDLIYNIYVNHARRSSELRSRYGLVFNGQGSMQMRNELAQLAFTCYRDIQAAREMRDQIEQHRLNQHNADQEWYVMQYEAGSMTLDALTTALERTQLDYEMDCAISNWDMNSENVADVAFGRVRVRHRIQRQRVQRIRMEYINHMRANNAYVDYSIHGELAELLQRHYYERVDCFAMLHDFDDDQIDDVCVTMGMDRRGRTIYSTLFDMEEQAWPNLDGYLIRSNTEDAVIGDDYDSLYFWVNGNLELETREQTIRRHRMLVNERVIRERVVLNMRQYTDRADRVQTLEEYMVRCRQQFYDLWLQQVRERRTPVPDLDRHHREEQEFLMWGVIAYIMCALPNVESAPEFELIALRQDRNHFARMAFTCFTNAFDVDMEDDEDDMPPLIDLNDADEERNRECAWCGDEVFIHLHGHFWCYRCALRDDLAELAQHFRITDHYAQNIGGDVDQSMVLSYTGRIMALVARGVLSGNEVGIIRDIIDSDVRTDEESACALHFYELAYDLCTFISNDLCICNVFWEDIRCIVCVSNEPFHEEVTRVISSFVQYDEVEYRRRQAELAQSASEEVVGESGNVIMIDYQAPVVEYGFSDATDEYDHIIQINSIGDGHPTSWIITHITEEQQCMVCLDSMNGDEVVLVVCPGGHIFHQECANSWMTNRCHSCPICRHAML